MSREFQIRQNLRIKHREHNLNRLQFDDDTIVDQQVQPQTGLETKIVIGHWNRELPLSRKGPTFQLVYKARLITGFKQSWPKRRVNLESSVDNLCRSQFRFGWQRTSI